MFLIGLFGNVNFFTILFSILKDVCKVKFWKKKHYILLSLLLWKFLLRFFEIHLTIFGVKCRERFSFFLVPHSTRKYQLRCDSKNNLGEVQAEAVCLPCSLKWKLSSRDASENIRKSGNSHI